MLDEDLAELYGITTGNLNKAVKRNYTRFPDDFMFQLKKGTVAKRSSAKPIRRLDVPNWNIKLGRQAEVTLCHHQAGCCNAVGGNA